MELSKIVTALNVYCHPNLAESWDNVGLLIEPTPPHNVKTILITNDLSDQVVDEAIKSNCGLIFSYHPPIFVPFKRMTQANWKKRNIIKCIENKIGIYSPHTCLDGKEDGLNDFLLSPFELSSKVSVTPPGFMNDDVYEATANYDENFKRFSLAMPIAPTAVDIQSATGRVAKFKYPKSQKENIHEMLKKHNVNLLTEEVITRPQPMGQGSGRVGMLQVKKTIKDIVDAYKTLLGTSQIKVAFGKKKGLSDEASCIAVCAGSGGKLLTCQAPALLADVLVTGEASHQEQLEAISRGATMIIIGHATVERKYLSAKVLPWMKSELSNVDIIFAQTDKDPVEIV